MEFENVSDAELLALISDHRSFLQVANDYNDFDRSFELESVIEYFCTEADNRGLEGY